MTVLFAHDTRFHKHNNVFYSNGLNSNVFRRYLSEFSNIIVCGREVCHEDDETPRENLASTDNVTFDNIPDKNAIYIWFNKADREHIKKLVESADFVIARLDSIIGFIAVDYAVKMRKPYMIELCTDPWDCYINYGIKGKLLAPFIYKKTKNLVRNAPNVVYVTNEYLQKRYPTKGKNVAISNVECHPDNLAYSANLEKYANFKKSDTIVLGTAGALLPFKGQRYVIEALGFLKNQGFDNIIYRLAGAGSDLIYLQKLAKKLNVSDQVEFLGTLNRNEMKNFYKSLNVYIQPSLQEGLPRTVIEAMSNGLCCFGSRTAGTPELLLPECVFENKNPMAIVELLSTLDKEKLISYSKRNFLESQKYESATLFNKRKTFLNEITKQ